MNLIETPKKSIFKKSMQNQLQAVIREREIKNCMNSKTLTTKIVSQKLQTTTEKRKGNIQTAHQSL